MRFFEEIWKKKAAQFGSDYRRKYLAKNPGATSIPLDLAIQVGEMLYLEGARAAAMVATEMERQAREEDEDANDDS